MTTKTDDGLTATHDLRLEFEALVQEALLASTDVADTVRSVLQDGIANPLPRAEAVQVLTKLVKTLEERARSRRDTETVKALADGVDRVVHRVIEARDRITRSPAPSAAAGRSVKLLDWNGVTPHPVLPTPYFHRLDVPMVCGYVCVQDIPIWEGNSRLEIHIEQFRKQNGGRDPRPEELLDIMLSRIQLPGVHDEVREDQFAIIALARSIAVNGVRKPPIIDVNGDLLDGNRRVTACNYILASSEFTIEQKKRAEKILVWQLTPHATDKHRDAVIVSLNFEPDHKQDWPEYVRARRVYEEWEAALALEPSSPGKQRQAQIKREISENLALGPNSTAVNRYIKMMETANEFETHHVAKRRKDEHEVKHNAAHHFQYFDELSKGATSPGGVAYEMNHDDWLKELVFDLLYDDKFKNWRQVRKIGQIAQNKEARECLKTARDEKNPDTAQEIVEDAISIARTRREASRAIGANTRINAFLDWFEQLPLKAFRDSVEPEVRLRLLAALQLADGHLRAIDAAGPGDQED